MKELYVIYYRNSSNKLYETRDFNDAINFVERMEKNKRKNGDFEWDKYEIVKIDRSV